MHSWRGVALLGFLNPLLLFADKLEETTSVANGEHIKDATNYILAVLEYKWNIDRWIFKIIFPFPSVWRDLFLLRQNPRAKYSHESNWYGVEASISVKLAIRVIRFSTDYGNVTIRILSSECSLRLFSFLLTKVYRKFTSQTYILAMILFFPPRINFTA